MVTPPPLGYSTPDRFGEDGYLSKGCEGWDTPPKSPPTPGLAQRQQGPDLNPNPNAVPNPHRDCRGGAYHLYIYFNKAFNSVPRGALFRALRGYRFPGALVQALGHLYSTPRNTPS